VGDAILSILPYAIAAALAAPIVAVVTAVILSKSSRPVPGGLMFTAGAGSLDVLVATVILVAFWGTDAATAGGDAGAYIDTGLGVLFLALGVTAVFQKDSPEKDAARRRRVDQAATASLGRLFIVGIVAQIINFDALTVFAAGLKEILGEDLSPGGAAVVVAVAVVVMLIPYYAPIIVYVRAGDHAEERLTRMTDWLLSRSRALEIVVGIGFGVIFLAKGLQELS
jgi:threonine/homoserine/homoserine lactone efflux protein